jgi:hypothetical protein
VCPLPASKPLANRQAQMARSAGRCHKNRRPCCADTLASPLIPQLTYRSLLKRDKPIRKLKPKARFQPAMVITSFVGTSPILGDLFQDHHFQLLHGSIVNSSGIYILSSTCTDASAVRVRHLLSLAIAHS